MLRFFENFRSIPSKSSIKIVLIGDGAIGKTSYFNRIASGETDNYKFSKAYDATRGCNVCKIDYFIGKQIITLHLFDTAGQEKFGALRDSYLLGADGVIIMYDITDQKTKDNVIKNWLPEVKRITNASNHHKSYIPIAVIANKSDKLDTSSSEYVGLNISLLRKIYFANDNTNANSNLIEIFTISVKADENLMSPINWLLDHILSYCLPVNVKRTEKMAIMYLCNNN
jgi:GTP-binding nuclear protein Ran